MTERTVNDWTRELVEELRAEGWGVDAASFDKIREAIAFVFRQGVKDGLYRAAQLID